MRETANQSPRSTHLEAIHVRFQVAPRHIARQNAGRVCLPAHPCFSGRGAIWTGEPDAAGRDFDRANIAEGSGRGGNRELVRFLQIARGSAHELEFHILAATDLGFLGVGKGTELIDEVGQISRMLQGLIRKLRVES